MKYKTSENCTKNKFFKKKQTPKKQQEKQRMGRVGWGGALRALPHPKPSKTKAKEGLGEATSL